MYTLPIEAAQQRLVTGEDVDVHQRILREDERRRTYGLRQAALALSAALSERAPERTLLTPKRFRKPPMELAAGYVLAERLDYTTKGKGYLQTLGGVLLTRGSGIYVYEARLPADARTEWAVTAWGHDKESLHRDQREISCHRIEAVDLLDTGEVPRRDQLIGAIAGPLTLDDLLAGRAVRDQIELPDITVPDLA